MRIEQEDLSEAIELLPSTSNVQTEPEDYDFDHDDPQDLDYDPNTSFLDYAFDDEEAEEKFEKTLIADNLM